MKVDPHAFDSFRAYADHCADTRAKYYEHLVNRPEDFDKPTVYFEGKVEYFYIGDAEVASVMAVNHPYWGHDRLRTSTVLTKFDNGGFETRNTIYLPVGIEEMGS